MLSNLFIGSLFMGMLGTAGAAGELEQLPPPRIQGEATLMQALKSRHSIREFSAQPISQQTLSDLLWAAAGVNRRESGKRTAPSARDWREIEIYVVRPQGVQVYIPESHSLRRISYKDIRAATGAQDFPAVAPLNLVYVANYDKMVDADVEQKEFYAATDTGFVAQNVYLYCASAGLGTVVRGSLDRRRLANILGLKPYQHITLAQTVGFPG